VTQEWRAEAPPSCPAGLFFYVSVHEHAPWVYGEGLGDVLGVLLGVFGLGGCASARHVYNVHVQRVFG